MSKTFLLRRFFQDEFPSFKNKIIESHNLKKKILIFKQLNVFKNDFQSLSQKTNVLWQRREDKFSLLFSLPIVGI